MGLIQTLLSFLKLSPQDVSTWLKLLSEVAYLVSYSDHEINEEEALFLFILGDGEIDPLEEPVGFAAKLPQEKRYDALRAVLEAKGFAAASAEVLARLKGSLHALPPEHKQPFAEAILSTAIGVSSIDKRLSQEEGAFIKSLSDALDISPEKIEQQWSEAKDKLAPHRLLIEHLFEVYLLLMNERPRAEDEMMLVSEKLERFPKALTDAAVKIATEQHLDSPGAVGFFIGLLGGLEGGDEGLVKVGLELISLISTYRALHQKQDRKARLLAIKRGIEEVLSRDPSLKDSNKGFFIGLISSMERFNDAQRKLLKGDVAEALGIDMKEIEMITMLLKSSEPRLHKNVFG